MAVSITACRGQIIAVLDSNTSGTRVYGTNNDPLVTTTEIDNAILNADAHIVQMIYETPGHPLLSTFRTTASVASGGLLPARVGPILGIIVNSKVPTRYPAKEIEFERSNAQSLTLTTVESVYDIEGERLVHNGASSATIDYVPVFSVTSSCQAPDGYAPAVVAGALAEIRQKQGNFSQAAAYWQRRFEFFIAQIRGGSRQLGELGQEPS